MGLLDSLAGLFTGGQRRRDLHQLVMACVSDGQLSDSERERIQQAAVELGLSPDELGPLPERAFRVAAEAAVADNQVDDREIEALQRIQEFLRVAPNHADPVWHVVYQLGLATKIRAGELPGHDPEVRPLLDVPGLVLTAGEVVHWAVPGSLLEERVVRRGYVGGSAGVNVRIVRGVSVNVGRHKGDLVSERGIVPVSDGTLVLTSKRVVFRGERKSFQLAFAKLMEYGVDGGTVRVTDAAGKSREVRLQDPSGGVVAEALLRQLTGA